MSNTYKGYFETNFKLHIEEQWKNGTFISAFNNGAGWRNKL